MTLLERSNTGDPWRPAAILGQRVRRSLEPPGATLPAVRPGQPLVSAHRQAKSRLTHLLDHDSSAGRLCRRYARPRRKVGPARPSSRRPPSVKLTGCSLTLFVQMSATWGVRAAVVVVGQGYVHCRLLEGTGSAEANVFLFSRFLRLIETAADQYFESCQFPSGAILGTRMLTVSSFYTVRHRFCPARETPRGRERLRSGGHGRVKRGRWPPPLMSGLAVSMKEC